MRIQLDNTRFILGEGFKFSNDMKHKPDKSHQPCNMRLSVHHKTHASTRFIFSINNEAVLVALIKVKHNELNFAKVISIAIITQGTARVTRKDTAKTGQQDKETCHYKDEEVC